MQTRQKVLIEVRYYALILNPMMGRAEDCNVVAVSTDYEKLVEWVKGELAPEVWTDPVHTNGCGGPLKKRFKEGSHLEWFNPPTTYDLNPDTIFSHGIFGGWMNIEEWENTVLTDTNIHCVCRD